jgi:hypothetical protein
MTSLFPCPRCDRHVKRHERACPFCAASLTPPPQAVDPFTGSERLSRAAQALLGALAGASSVSCAGDRQAGGSHPETAERNVAAIEPAADASPLSQVDERSDAGAIADGSGISSNVDAGHADADEPTLRLIAVYGAPSILISEAIPFAPGSSVVPTRGALAVLVCTGGTRTARGACRSSGRSTFAPL